jgi:hypothetical protein
MLFCIQPPMTITEVSSPKEQQAFLDLVRKIYADDSNFICPLDKDVEATFHPETNSFFQHGSCTLWILSNEKGEHIGRIAAFINDKKAYQHEVPTGGIGYFECIDDQKAADLLFDTAKEWLSTKGMKAMDGPINFGENDTFWGLLVEGFTPPSYGMNYHKPYYHALFKNYGFEKEYEQITNHLDLRLPFPERFTKIAEWVAGKEGYRFEHLKVSEFDRYADDFMEIYNDAWQGFENFVPLNKDIVMDSFRKMKLIMDEKLIWFAYVNNEPVSFVVILPDANQLIKSFNGKLGIWQKIQFVYNKWKGVRRMRAVVMGTKIAFQKHGLESALFIKLKHYVIPKNQYDELELSWVGDFNDKMIAIHQATGATFGKRHLTMRKIF